MQKMLNKKTFLVGFYLCHKNRIDNSIELNKEKKQKSN